MGRVRARCRAFVILGLLCGIAATLALGACAGRPVEPPPGIWDAPAEPPSLPRVSVSAGDSTRADAAADSLGEEPPLDPSGAWLPAGGELAEEGAPDDAVSETAASLVAADAADAADAAPDARAARASYEMTAIAGYRSEARFRAGAWRGFSIGMRAGQSITTGYVRYEGRGLVRCLHVGRMVPRAGERLLLGRGLGAYEISGVGMVRHGFEVSPSLSAWFGVAGAAVELGGGPWRFQTAALESPGTVDRPAGPVCVWNYAVREFTRVSVGLMTAFVPHVPSDVPPGTKIARLRAAGGHVAFRGDGYEGSAEAVQAGTERYFAGRATGKGRRARWSLFVFDAPYDVPPGGPGAQAAGKTVQGVTVNVSSRGFGTKGSIRFSAGRRVSSSGRSEYRRVVAEVEGGSPGPFRWLIRAYGKTDRSADFPSQPVVRELSTESTRELALRAALRTDDRNPARMAARIDYLPAAAGRGPGTVLSISVDLETGRLDGRASVACHSLAPGRRSFVSRPGIGPFETFGSLYGRGSDLSLRIRVRLAGASRLVFVYVSPWRGPERAYIGLECRP